MLLSVFTPSHNPQYLDECYASLRSQSFPDWEWVVLLNGKATGWAPPEADDRVRVEKADSRVKGLGAVKREAAERCRGDVLLELDHDDRLMAGALAEVADAFIRHPDAAMVYSDFAHIDPAGMPLPPQFDPDAGWTYDAESVDGTTYYRCHALEASAHNLGYIWYAPNHVRAFRRSSYDAVGGYDRTLTHLEDQDLMIRLFDHGRFIRIPKLLYLQRLHPRSSRSKPAVNAAIQEDTVGLYLDHIDRLALAWTGHLGLTALSFRMATTIGDPVVDERYRVAQVEPTFSRFLLDDNSIGVIRATDILQRVADRATFLNECHRVLAPGGLLLTDTPSTDGRGAFQDPSHIAFYNENSFSYLTRAELRVTIPALTARLQVSHLTTYLPSERHEALGIPYVKANLIAVKEGPRQGGPLFC